MKIGSRNRFAGVASVALMVGSALGGTAQAQADTSASDAAKSAGTVDDIVVTARRREERLQDVPLAVTAFSGEKLAEANVTKIDDLVRIAPGLVSQASAFGTKVLTLTLRSQRQNLPNLTYDPSVVIYFAEVPNMRMMGANASLYDLASVQILKGPQGTLFGRNSTGGALLITPQAPSDEFGGYAKAGFGDYGAWQAEGAINVPLNEKFQIRLAARHSQHKGYQQVIGQDYAIEDDNTDAYRASLRFDSGEGFTNTLIVDYMNQTGSGTGFVLRSCNPLGVANGAAFKICDDFARKAGQPFNATTSNVDRNGTRIKGYAVSNITTAEVGNITLKNIAGYRYLNSFISFDIDGSSKNVLSATDLMIVDQITDEVQILGTAFDDSLNYQVGAFFFEESGPELQQTPTLGTLSYSDLSVVNRSYSIFGQVTYKLPWLEGLSATGGLRQTWDKRQMINRGRTITAAGVDTCRILTANVGGVPIGSAANGTCQKTVDAAFKAFTYNFSLDWKVNQNLLVYVATRKGYRAGGFLNSPRAPAEFAPYLPEKITDYEVGVKADYRFGGVIGRTNIAVYTGNYKDIQRTISETGLTDPLTGGTFTRNSIVNAEKARISGVELEQMLKPFDLLELKFSYAYSDAKFKKFISPKGLDYTKAPFAGAPKHTLSGAARLQLPVGEDAGDVFVQFSGSHTSSSIAVDVTSFNPVTQMVLPTSILDSYTTFDARIEWNNAMGTPLSLAGYVRNLTDKGYFSALQDASALGFVPGIPGTPRTFGFEARYDF